MHNRDRDVSFLGVAYITSQIAGCDRMFMHQMIDQHARAGARLSIDKAQAMRNDVRDTCELRRQLAAHHQAWCAGSNRSACAGRV